MGYVPFVSSFAMFAAGRAFEQVRNSIGYPHLNVKIGATHGGISVGEDGASHQCCEDFALMRSIPGMTVICPADDVEARAAVRAAYEMEGPVYLRFGRNACMDELRHEKTAQRFAVYMREEPEAVDDSKYLEYELLIDRIHHAVEQLPTQTRNVFKRCFLEGRRYQDVGAEFGITVNTVKAHVMKALRILREQFSSEEFILLFLCFRKSAEKK